MKMIFFVVCMWFKGRYRVNNQSLFQLSKLRSTLINISKLKVVNYVLSRTVAASCHTNTFLNLQNYLICMEDFKCTKGESTICLAGIQKHSIFLISVLISLLIGSHMESQEGSCCFIIFSRPNALFKTLVICYMLTLGHKIGTQWVALK